MMDSEIKFEREELDGIVAVGTYLSDAAHRFGIRSVEKCDPSARSHNCRVKIVSGGETLSPLTEAEKELAGKGEINADERLACQARVIEAGEVVIMTNEQKDPEEQETKADPSQDYRKNFSELPLEKKIADLVRLEAMTFNETLSFIFNSPYHVAGKVFDVLAEFGFKKDSEDKAAKRPEEHLVDDDLNSEEQNGEDAEIIEAVEVQNEAADNDPGQK